MSNSDNWNGTGYDAETGNSGGLYFRLKTKGQRARLRLVSACYRYTDTLTQNGEAKTIRKAAWVAILKEIVDGKPQKRVVIFQNGPMVYGLVKDLNDSAEWGDPQEYDIEVTRTEEQGKYYTVTPLPKPMGPISDEERAMVAEANINVVEACRTKDTHAGGTIGDQGTGEYDPFADE